MILTLTPSEEFADLNGMPCRVWAGTDEQGTPLLALIPLIMVRLDQPREAFEAELIEIAVSDPQTRGHA